MKAKLLIDILSLNPEGEIYIDDYDRRKEITVQIDQCGRVELKAGDVVEHDKKDEGIRKLEEIEAEMEVS